MTKANACCAPPIYTGGHTPNQKITTATAAKPHDFIALAGGSFAMGAADGPHPQDGEGPVREATLDPFALAPLTVTNTAFEVFAQDTGYVTQAERTGASFVFDLMVPAGTAVKSMAHPATWWLEIEGANWRTPYGPKGIFADAQPNHPVVHINLFDALAYCEWAGTRLPSEAEWEYAARSGLTAKPFPWGDTLLEDGVWQCNIWQGQFPHENTAEDGHVGTAPAKCFEPNRFGLYAMTGNVWEWTADRFTTLHSPRPVRNPKGPLNGDLHVAKGGSYLCHASYCMRYRTSSRQGLDPRTATGHIGFRVAKKKT
jgi:sulfatase modifying factor 1